MVPGLFARSLETAPLDRNLSTTAYTDSIKHTSTTYLDEKGLGGRSRTYRLVASAVADATVASGAQERHHEVLLSGTGTSRGVRSVLHTLTQCGWWISTAASGQTETETFRWRAE